MANPNPMFLEKPYSLAHARSMFGGTDPDKIALLLPALIFDYGFESDEFTGTLSTNSWTTAVTGGAGPTAFAYNAQRGGVIQGSTGTTPDDVTAIHCAQTYLDPEDNPFMLIRFEISAITFVSFEIGFSDPKADEALPGCSDIDTVTIDNGVTDIAAVHMDTGQTLTTAALIGNGTTGSALKSSIYFGGPGGSTGFTPTASTWQTWIIGVRPNLCYASVWNGLGFVGRFSVGQGPDAGVLVRPYALFRTRNATGKTVNIDKIAWGWERDWS